MVEGLYGIVAACYGFGLRNPAWALAALVVVELTLSGYVPGTNISVRLATALASALVTAPIIAGAVQFWDARLRSVLLPSIVFVGVATAGNLLFSDIGYVFKYFRWQVVQVIALVLAAAVVRDRRDLRMVILSALAIATVSAVLAIWQQYAPASALYAGMTTEELANWGGRSVGLTKSPVILANQLTFVLLPLLGVVTCGPARADYRRLLLWTGAIALTAGVYCTFTRSALIAMGPGLLAMASFLTGIRRMAIVLTVLSMPLVYIGLQGSGLIGERYYQAVGDDSSAASHLAMLQVGTEVALDNWLVGIGHEWFEEESTRYLDALSGDVVDAGGAAAVGESRVHNDFLSVWFSWGILGLCAYLAIFVGTISNCTIAARSQDWLIRGLAVGTVGGLVTYGVNSAFHNYLDASAVLWLYGGLSVTLVRLANAASVRRLRRIARLRSPARMSHLRGRASEVSAARTP